MRDPASQPVISVVVPCRGQARELEGCLRGLHGQLVEFPYEVIVVDAAADPEVAAVAEGFPKARLVRDASGLLAGEARNLGAEQARGRYLAFLDADCVPEPAWLAAVLSALREGKTRIVGGAVLDRFPFHPVAVPDNLLQFVDFSAGRPAGPLSHFPSCNFAVERAAFQELGGFPRGVPFGEDVLFSGAAEKKWPGGASFVPAMRVRHLGRTGLRAFWRHQTDFGYHRGLLGLHLSPHLQRLLSMPFMEAIVVSKRLVYVVRRAARWRRAALLCLVWLWPILLFGLGAYARGVRLGCREALRGVR
jgi:glycosyltransferase involved in cell wall biosynthesis